MKISDLDKELLKMLLVRSGSKKQTSEVFSDLYGDDEKTELLTYLKANEKVTRGDIEYEVVKITAPRLGFFK